MLLYGVAIATGTFQCEGMWSAARSSGSEIGMLGREWGRGVKKAEGSFEAV